MNLWARRIGQLLMVAPFLFACEEDTSVLGFKNPNSKFEVRYVEIPLTSTNYLVDSVMTSTFASNGVGQFLVGKYTDPDLGEVTAIAQTRFLPVSRSKIDVASKFDSGYIELRYTFNVVGSTQAATDQTVEVFELAEAMDFDSLPYYMNRSLKAVTPELIGTTTSAPNPVDFKKYVTDRKDTTIVLKIEIDAFGEDLLNTALAYSNGTDLDSTYYYIDKFVEKYKGLSFQPVSSDDNDKIFGLSILDPASKIDVFFSAPDDTVASKISFTFSTNASSRMMAFNHITSDRAGTEVDGMSFYQDHFTANDIRYSQSGIGIMTKLDFANFFSFTDTIPKISGTGAPAIIINSAELVLSDIQKTGGFDPLGSYKLGVLKDNNRLQPVKTNADTLNLIAYSGWLTRDPNVARFPIFTAVGDQGTSAVVNYSSTNNNYSAFLSVFFQELSIEKENKTQFTKFVLIPSSIRINQDVSRFGVHKDNIKLKIYYTIPTLYSNN